MTCVFPALPIETKAVDVNFVVFLIVSITFLARAAFAIDTKAVEVYPLPSTITFVHELITLIIAVEVLFAMISNF